MTARTLSLSDDDGMLTPQTPAPASDRHHVCVSCRERRSLFRCRGAVRADRDHTLCFQCYRALHNSKRAQRLAHIG